MCPIYKKNDCNEIANYKPIMLLNTPEIKSNIFLQSWKTKTMKRAGVSQDIQDLLESTKKIGLQPEGIAFQRKVI